MEILLATHNQHKKEEIELIFTLPIQIKTLSDFQLYDDIPEVGQTFQENALIKAKYGYEKTGIPCFADDSGLVINALNGEPGIYSARYSGSQNFSDNIALVLEKMKTKQDKSAYFISVIAYYDGIEEKYFEGIIKGEISTEIKGEKGFGYDPIFIPLDYNKSFAEMSSAEKNTISHRYLALKKFESYLSSLPKN